MLALTERRTHTIMFRGTEITQIIGIASHAHLISGQSRHLFAVFLTREGRRTRLFTTSKKRMERAKSYKQTSFFSLHTKSPTNTYFYFRIKSNEHTSPLFCLFVSNPSHDCYMYTTGQSTGATKHTRETRKERRRMFPPGAHACVDQNTLSD